MTTHAQPEAQSARDALDTAAQTARTSYDPFVWFDAETHQLVDPLDALSHPGEYVIEAHLSDWLAALPVSAAF